MKSQQKIRDYPEYADMLDIPSVGVMGLRFGATKVRIPFTNVSKNRRFIKGIDWAMSKLMVKPTQELTKQERDAEANLKRLKGSNVTAVARLNKMSPMQMVRVSSPLHMVLDKMHDISIRKGGGSARALSQGGDPFWYGVMRLGEVLSEVAPWDTMDRWRSDEIVRLFKKHAGLELNPETGRIRLPWKSPKSEGVTEAKAVTHHDKCGKFCPAHKAHTITKNGVRYKPVRQLRKLKGAKTRSKKVTPPQEEAIVDIIDRDPKAVVDAMVNETPHGWIPLKDYLETKRVINSG